MSAVLATYHPSRYAVCSVLHLVELHSQVRARGRGRGRGRGS